MTSSLNFKPKILLISNFVENAHAFGQYGQLDGFELLKSENAIKSITNFSFSVGVKDTATQRLINILKNNKFDLILLLSPKNFPSSFHAFEEIISAIGSAKLAYWEGDAFGITGLPGLGAKKPITEQMTWWLQSADFVFSVAGNPLASEYYRLGATTVFQTLHTYCHKLFMEEEKNPPHVLSSENRIAIMIGSNLALIPGLTGLPGSSQRFELAIRLRASRQIDFRLFGRQWPRILSTGVLPFERQAREIRSSFLSVNWDHFSNYENYSSDRFAISMISGRPHFTSRHTGFQWAPTESDGLVQLSDPKEFKTRILELIHSSPEQHFRKSLALHSWVRNRLSHREAVRFMVSTIYSGIKKPPTDPWRMFEVPIPKKNI